MPDRPAAYGLPQWVPGFLFDRYRDALLARIETEIRPRLNQRPEAIIREGTDG